MSKGFPSTWGARPWQPRHSHHPAASRAGISLSCCARFMARPHREPSASWTGILPLVCAPCARTPVPTLAWFYALRTRFSPRTFFSAVTLSSNTYCHYALLGLGQSRLSRKLDAIEAHPLVWCPHLVVLFSKAGVSSSAYDAIILLLHTPTLIPRHLLRGLTDAVVSRV